MKEAGITARWLEQMEKKLAKIERDRKWAALNKKAKEADDITYSSVLDELIAWKHEHADDRKEASRAKNAAQSMLTRIAAKSHTMDSGLREQLTSDAVPDKARTTCLASSVGNSQSDEKEMTQNAALEPLNA